MASIDRGATGRDRRAGCEPSGAAGPACSASPEPAFSSVSYLSKWSWIPWPIPLPNSVRQGGRRLLVAGLRSGLRERIGADGLVAGGSRLAATVRSLQKAGHGVLLVSGGPAHAALRAADVGVGVDGHGRHPPWGAALLTRPGLADAHLVVESLPVARSVSTRSVAFSAAGSAVGAAWSFLGPASSASGERPCR